MVLTFAGGDVRLPPVEWMGPARHAYLPDSVLKPLARKARGFRVAGFWVFAPRRGAGGLGEGGGVLGRRLTLLC